MPLLEIVIPTYNHPNYMSAIMSTLVSHFEMETDFTISVYDSSTNDETQKVMSSFICDRVKYVRIDPDIDVDTKTIMALKSVEADYSFLCGDGHIVDVRKLIKLIKNNKNNDEVIVLYDSKWGFLHKFMSKQTKFVFTDKNEFFKLHFWQLTLYGGSLCARRVLEKFNLYELQQRFSGLGFIYPSALAIYSLGPYSAVEDDLLTPTDKHRIGGWEKSGNAVKTWSENFYKSVIQLDNVLSDESCNFIIKNANKNSNRFNIKCLLNYRLNDNYNLKILRQYKFYFKKCKACSMFSAYVIALTPKWIINCAKKVYKALRGKR